MLFSSLNTGSTDLRDTEVQQPNTTATLSLVISSSAFSANSGQFDAGSTTTGSSFLPRTPPFLFCSSISMSMASFSVVSLIAMVPESECSTPILIVSCACAAPSKPVDNATVAASNRVFFLVQFANDIGVSLSKLPPKQLNSPSNNRAIHDFAGVAPALGLSME